MSFQNFHACQFLPICKTGLDSVTNNLLARISNVHVFNDSMPGVTSYSFEMGDPKVMDSTLVSTITICILSLET